MKKIMIMICFVLITLTNHTFASEYISEGVGPTEKAAIQDSFRYAIENVIGLDMSDLPNLKAGLEGRPLMYGPYIDKRTLHTDISNKKFADDVTLMFSSTCKNHSNQIRILCCRTLNDDMSNVIQDEDTHIYKDSGDNYLFMVKSNRGIKPGTAIRSEIPCTP